MANESLFIVISLVRGKDFQNSFMLARGGDPVICRRNILGCVESEGAGSFQNSPKKGAEEFFFCLWWMRRTISAHMQITVKGELLETDE